MTPIKLTPDPAKPTPRSGTADSKVGTFHSEMREMPDMQWIAENINAILRAPQESRQNILRLVKELFYPGIGSSVEDSEKSRAGLSRALSSKVKDLEGNDIWEARAAAALMLGATCNRDALPALLNQFEKEERAEVRECITLAIGKIGLDSELVRQFTVNMLLQYHTLMWEPGDTRTAYVDSVRSFLYSDSGHISVSLSGDVPEGMAQNLLRPSESTSGEDNWQLRAASALLLGAGSVWGALPVLVKAAAKDGKEDVRKAAYAAAVRIGRESPKDAKNELACFIAPAKGEQPPDQEMGRVAIHLLKDVNELDGLRLSSKMQPSLPVITLIVEDSERLKGYLLLAKGKGVRTSDHDYFHGILRDIGLERAITLLMGGECVKLNEENIPYVQDVVSKLAAAAFRKEGASAYGKALVALVDATLERAFELRKARKEAINLNPHYEPECKPKKGISKNEEAALLSLLRDAYHTGIYSIVVKEYGASRPIQVLLESSHIKMEEETISEIKKIIFKISIEAVRQQGSNAFDEAASAIVDSYIRADSPLFEITQDLPILATAHDLIGIMDTAKPFRSKRGG